MFRQIASIFTAVALLAVFAVNGLACHCPSSHRRHVTRRYASTHSSVYRQAAYRSSAYNSSAYNNGVYTNNGTRYYAEAPVHHGHSTRNKILSAAIPAGIGAGIGALAGGGKGAGIGALAGGGAGMLFYYLKHKH